MVKEIQTQHIKDGSSDIIYNFIVSGDGRVYVGCGFKIKGDHTFHHNDKSICIAFTGSYDKRGPSDTQVDAAKALIEFGVKNNFIASDYTLYAQRSLNPESTGKALFDVIMKWPNWKSFLDAKAN